MRWQGRRQSDNVEDRRGEGGGFPGGIGRGGGFRIPGGSGIRTARGGGLSGIIILAAIFLFLKFCTNIDPMQILVDGGGGQLLPGGQSQTDTSVKNNDEMTQFVRTVLAETEDTWSGIFQASGQNYPAPTLVLFDGQVQSACGFASSASGPFYCPGDKKLYIDLRFYDELDRKFGASGDFAQAYVLAHEVGHHVQNLIGVLPKFNQMRQSMGQAEANAMSVRVELQADCFAGIWGHFTQQKGILDVGDLDEALNAAQQIGDDTLQRRTQGYVVPESFNHGTSDQRSAWFKRGFESGKLESCDTFNANI
ncbi:zinc metallopeptidase [Phyllobacterium sp. 0TCS1.6C]|uniref:KPN_02809 family neutral zinc metallopeptidase n=1 Tax=unclassified Phyllobacterium TaxID=2638441 RepID=UPI0022651623|nr:MULTISPECIES: neutral zinc metallopeptidase [unclassified Phyllobacterium]MCX8282280.1 zinc metallopeptidase [Phyllobacterium sp. 0TCS1.6C]MCX8292094.1 zinc metallopeptidase [Phyllobacterium sp. 0TCS1.6A]